MGTPDPGVYFRILKEHDVAGMFVAPTAIRAIRREVSDGVEATWPLNDSIGITMQ